MSLTPRDYELEEAKRLVTELFSRAEAATHALRQALEEERPLKAPLEVMAVRDAVASSIAKLCGVLEPALAPKALGITGLDPQSLQDFRRAAQEDLERLRAGFKALCREEWRSGADASRLAALQRAGVRMALCCALAVAVLAGWWAWQERRKAVALDLVNRAKAETAARAVELVSFTAWLAARTQGKPLDTLAADMTADCAGIDVRQTLPNHPCREAWAAGGQALFRASVPGPGKPVDCPSELFSDPWGAPFILAIPKNGPPAVLSAGPDGKTGTADDISVPVPYWGDSLAR